MTERILEVSDNKYVKIVMTDKTTTITECDRSGSEVSCSIPQEFGMYNESSKVWLWTSKSFENKIMKAVKKGKYVDN